MRKAGIKDYEDFALKVLNIISDKPVSFEVFADDLKGMYEQAKVIKHCLSELWEGRTAWVDDP